MYIQRIDLCWKQLGTKEAEYPKYLYSKGALRTQKQQVGSPSNFVRGKLILIPIHYMYIQSCKGYIWLIYFAPFQTWVC